MDKKNSTDPKNKPGEKKAVKEEQQQTQQAHQQADKDIEKDPDLSSKPGRGDDLDEGELARLEGED